MAAQISTSWILALTVVAISGCVSSEQNELGEAQSEAQKAHYRIAVSHYESVILRSPGSPISLTASREAAKLAFFELKDFKKAAQFYQKIVLQSPDAAERLASQKQIVLIYFDQLGDYEKSVVEINKLSAMLETPQEKAANKILLARAYYHQSNYIQAENEVDEFLRNNPSLEQKFDMLLLKANIEIAKKDMPAAIVLLSGLLKEFPERAIKENVAVTLSVCYEEMKDFKSSVETLEKLREKHPMPEYVDVRIKKLKERIQNQPGARGRIRK